MHFTLTKKLAEKALAGEVNYKLINAGLSYTDDFTAGFIKGFLHGIALAQPLADALETVAPNCKHRESKQQAQKVLAYWSTVLNGDNKESSEKLQLPSNNEKP